MTVHYGAGAPPPAEQPGKTRSLALRTLLLPSLLALAGLVVLLALGTWQMQRLAYKEALSAQIKARLTAPAISLAEAARLFAQDPEAAEYTRVKLRGRFDNAREIHLYGLRDKQAGWLILTPFLSDDGNRVLVNRGFVPRHLKDQATRRDGLISGPTEVYGLLRRPAAQKTAFGPANNPAQNRWFRLDLPAMLTHAFAPEARRRVVPFIIDAQATPQRQSWPRGGATRITFANRHLEYALTWYGLAVTLLVVYGFFVWSHLRRPSP